MEKKITVYSTSSCGWCRVLKEKFDQQGVKYVALDVANDQAAQALILERTGGVGVPMTIIASPDGTEQVVRGYNEQEFIDAGVLSPST